VVSIGRSADKSSTWRSPVKTLLIYALTTLAALGVEAGLAYLWLIGVAPQFEKQLSHH